MTLLQNFGDIVQYKSVTSNYTISSTDQVIWVDASAGTVVLTLPLATAKPGKVYTVIRKDTTTNVIRVNGALTYTYVYKSQTFVSEGNYWWLSQSDNIAMSWSGYFDGSCSWSTTSSSFADPTVSGTPNLVQRTNTNFGTVTKAASSLPGFTFTPTRLGNYFVSMTPVIYKNAGGQSAVQMTDGTNVLNNSASTLYQAATTAMGQTFCGIENVTSLSPITIKLQLSITTGTTGIGGWGQTMEISTYYIDQVSIQKV
jgi:hypothetical protein